MSPSIEIYDVEITYKRRVRAKDPLAALELAQRDVRVPEGVTAIKTEIKKMSDGT